MVSLAENVCIVGEIRKKSDIYVDPIKEPLDIASAMIERSDCSEMRHLPKCPDIETILYFVWEISAVFVPHQVISGIISSPSLIDSRETVHLGLDVRCRNNAEH